MASAYRRAGVLRYAAIQFVVLVAGAMAAYPGGTWIDPLATRYQLAHNFLSDLGATRAFSGRDNYVSAALFAIALVTIGAALAAFAWAWRGFAFRIGRARAAGIASAVFGTASGAAFAGTAMAPVDRVLHVHNGFVITAFGMLLGYAACLTVVMARNRVGRLAPNLAYLALVCGYFGLVVVALRVDFEHGLVLQVVAQKIIVAASMVHIIYVTTMVRRTIAAPPDPATV